MKQNNLILVPVSQLSAVLQDIIAIWKVIGEPIDQDGKIWIEERHKRHPKQAKRVYDSAYFEYDQNTPLPLVPIPFK